MNIWKIYTKKERNLELTADEEEYDKLSDFLFEGEKLKDVWIPINVYAKYKGTDEIDTDVPMMGDSYFIVNDFALKIFWEIASDELECLDIIYPGKKYTLVNIINVLECLDLEESVYKTYKGDKRRIQKMDKYCFLPKLLQSKNLFKIKNMDGNIMFCSDKLKEALELGGIKGIGFEHIATI